MHIFDEDGAMTSSPDDLAGLVDRLLAKSGGAGDFTLADFMAWRDRLALYDCLPLLLPKAARAKCVQLIADRKATRKQISDLACIPDNLCALILTDEWPEVIDGLHNS